MRPNDASTFHHSHRPSDADHPVFIVYPRRWWMLFVFSSMALLNNMVCYSFAPIYHLAHEHFGADVNLESMVTSFFISYVIFSFPSSWIISRYGLRTGVVIGGWAQAIGCWVRVCHYYVPVGTFPMLLTGQVIASLGQSFFVNPPPLLASAWFADNERTLATTISVNANTLGIAAVYFVAPALVSVPSDIPFFLEFIAIFSLGFAICGSVSFQSAPPTPPSKSAHDKTPLGLAQIDAAVAAAASASESDSGMEVTPNDVTTRSSHSHNRLSQNGDAARIDIPHATRGTSEPSPASLAALSAALGSEGTDNTSPNSAVSHNNTTTPASAAAKTLTASTATYGTASAISTKSSQSLGASASSRSPSGTALLTIPNTNVVVSAPVKAADTPSPTLSSTSNEVVAITGSHRAGSGTNGSERSTPPLPSLLRRPSGSFRMTARSINKATFSMSGTLAVYMGLLKQSGFLHTVVAFAIAEMCINGFSAFLNPLLVPLGYDTGFIGLLGSTFIISCMVGSSLFSFVVDRTKTYRSAILLSLALSVVMTAYFIFVLHHFEHGTHSLAVHVTISLLLSGFFIGPIQPLAIEVAAECTYPVPESYATAVQQVIGNLFSAAMFPIMMYTRDKSSPNPYLKGVWFLTGGLLLSTLIYLTFNGRYKRLETELEHERKRKERQTLRAARKAQYAAMNGSVAADLTGTPAAIATTTANGANGATERDRLLTPSSSAPPATTYQSVPADELP